MPLSRSIYFIRINYKLFIAAANQWQQDPRGVYLTEARSRAMPSDPEHIHGDLQRHHIMQTVTTAGMNIFSFSCI